MTGEAWAGPAHSGRDGAHFAAGVGQTRIVVQLPTPAPSKALLARVAVGAAGIAGGWQAQLHKAEDVLAGGVRLSAVCVVLTRPHV